MTLGATAIKQCEGCWKQKSDLSRIGHRLLCGECNQLRSQLNKNGIRVLPTHKPKRTRVVTSATFQPGCMRHCWYCGLAFSSERNRNRTRDHQIPRSRGGGGLYNIVYACRLCNNRKGALTVEEYRGVLSTDPETAIKFYGEIGCSVSGCSAVW